jgi:hypothetical protein
MVKDYQQDNSDWQVDHLVILEKDSKILVAARQKDRCDLLFLIDGTTGDVYVRQPSGSWEALWGSESKSVIAHMVAARNRSTPTYFLRN